MLSGFLIGQEVTRRMPEVKEAKWSQPFPDCGYFSAMVDGVRRVVPVDMQFPPFVGGIPAVWTETRVADRVVVELMR